MHMWVLTVFMVNACGTSALRSQLCAYPAKVSRHQGADLLVCTFSSSDLLLSVTDLECTVHHSCIAAVLHDTVLPQRCSFHSSDNAPKHLLLCLLFVKPRPEGAGTFSGKYVTCAGQLLPMLH